MTVKHYEKAVALLRSEGHEPLAVRRPNEAMVAQLEALLGVMLPPSYRQMLLDLGLLQAGPIEISGLGNTGLDGSTASSVVFATRSARESGQIDATMIEIATMGDGGLYAIDCAGAVAGRESPVIEIEEGWTERNRTRVADSFGEFLLDRVEEWMKDEREMPKRDPTMTKAERRAQLEAYWKEQNAKPSI